MIYIVFRHTNKRYKVSTRIKIKPDQWNSKDQRPKRNYFAYMQLKRKLDQIAQDIYSWLLDGPAGDIPEYIRTNVLQIKKKTLFDTLDEFIDMKRKINGQHPVSHTKYTRLRNILYKFNPSLTYNDINDKVFSKWIEWMENEGYKNSYIATLVSALKTFARHLNKYGNASIDLSDSKYNAGQVDTIYLDDDELEMLLNYPYKQKYIKSAVHTFLIGCYTGMRYINFIKLDFENDIIVSNNVRMIKSIAAKSNMLIYIPIHPNLDKIINENVYARISNQKLNNYIKLAAKEAGLDQTVNLEVNKGGRQLIIKYAKYEKISTHTARRSFATNAYKAGIPVNMIMKITGHKTETQFLKYIRVSGEENAVILSRHQYFSSMKVI